MSEFKLVLPSVKYKDSFIEAVKEFQDKGVESYEKLSVIDLEKNFKKNIETLIDQSNYDYKENDQGPKATFWLVQDNIFIGRLQIRFNNNNLIKLIGHIGYSIRPSYQGKGLGKLILRLGLQKTREITNLKQIIITCKSDNYASQKVIEINNGKLIKKQKLNNGLMKYFYSIELY